MTELLSPAGSPEAVIAAVQNGADAVYLGLGNFNARRGAKNFTEEEFEKAVRYCRIRGCKVYVTLNTLVDDRETEAAVAQARLASSLGADALLVQDLGLVRALRAALPDMPLHASTQMSIHDLAGVEAAAALGLTRAVLARELSIDQIRYITAHASIETEIFVHGALCFCHSGQCYMSALIGRRSGNRGMCAQPCRMAYSLGGRMDDYPLSLKDSCLVEKLSEIEDAGVSCVKIEGRMKRPEYTALVTGVYAKVLHEHRAPTKDELNTLESAFSRGGFTQGYYNGDKYDMFGVRGESDERDRDSEKLFASARKAYSEGELRRVPLHFYTLCEKGAPIRAIAFDDEGHKAVASGPVPEDAKRQGLTEGFVTDQMFKTGGTPYNCVENRAKVDPFLFLPTSEINDLRRRLITAISEERATPPLRRSFPLPPLNAAPRHEGPPVTIVQVRSPDQLSDELCALRPDYLYFPAMSLIGDFSSARKFAENGTKLVAVLPRVITDDQNEDVAAVLEFLAGQGVKEALIGNLGHIALARRAGMALRGDFGLNIFNSRALSVLRDGEFLSATASFELRMAQIRDLRKFIDTEMIVYGRLPLMVSDQCVIRHSAGRCACSSPVQMSDRTGNVFHVAKEFGCRNVIYNAHKLYLADRRSDIEACGVWGARLMFTTESARECVEVARSYLGLSDYRPNVLTRGLYYRGVD